MGEGEGEGEGEGTKFVDTLTTVSTMQQQFHEQERALDNALTRPATEIQSVLRATSLSNQWQLQRRCMKGVVLEVPSRPPHGYRHWHPLLRCLPS